jgi:hypothetical protein
MGASADETVALLLEAMASPPAAVDAAPSPDEGRTTAPGAAAEACTRGQDATAEAAAETPSAPSPPLEPAAPAADAAAIISATAPILPAAAAFSAAAISAPPAALVPAAAAELSEPFEHMPWRVLIIRPAARDLSALDAPDKRAALHALSTLASGIWSGHDVKHLAGESVPSSLSLYESKFSKGARIIWSIGIDFVPLVAAYQQTIRVWAVDRTHDAAQRSIRRVCAIHRRGLTSLIARRLRTRAQRVAGTDCVLPKTYQVAPEGAVSFSQLERQYADGDADQAPAAAPVVTASGSEESTTRYPPAIEQEDAVTKREPNLQSPISSRPAHVGR